MLYIIEKMKRITLLLLMSGIFITANAQEAIKKDLPTEIFKDTIKYKVTFVELGSINCIPCKKMQVVMKSIEEKYGDQVKVEFHDVWTPAGKPYAVKYNIESIPAQIFLDENGKEYYRHKGFFPEEELIEVLKIKGVIDK